MTSSWWKKVELLVARLLAEIAGHGERAWETDFDVIALDSWPDGLEVDELTGHELIRLVRKGEATGWAVEVKSRQGLTIAEVEKYLAHNHQKAARHGLKNAVAVKRRAGVGRSTPVLLVIPLTEPWASPS